MGTTPAAVITPLVPFGSRMMTVWRYADVGFGILDESSANVDVEGLSYAPYQGLVFSDLFSEFEISLAHSRVLPDEMPSKGLLAQHKNSGLVAKYANNVLKDPLNMLSVVHDRGEGYMLSPSQVFSSATGTLMMPFPMNRNGEQVSEFDYYTWRDTAILGVGGPNGFGADIQSLTQVGDCATNIATAYGRGAVRSLGLPLLMDFKCFQDFDAVGLNGLATAFALPSEPFPIFRVLSSGAPTSESGFPVVINPEQASKATGGIIPSTGLPSLATDNTVMIGQLDLVVRVSRLHTIWFDTGSSTTNFLNPVIEPRFSEQPSGTNLVLAFRGASSINTVTTSPPQVVVNGFSADLGNALRYDAYGDPLETRLLNPAKNNCPNNGVLLRTFADFLPIFSNAKSTWSSDINELDGSRFIQARVTFISNAATGQKPELSTLAIPFMLSQP